jgi:hypothetical protein
MAQTIKLKRSATSGAIPTTSNLALGEVAINTYDGKMYIKKDVGGTESIVEIGGVGGNSVSYLEAGMIEYEYTATSNQTTFSGSDNNSATLSYTAGSILVFLNGVFQDDGVDYTATNGTSVVFGTALAANDEVRIAAFTNVTTTTSLQDPTKLDAITTVNAQAAYSLTLNSSAYTPSSQNALIVSLNGITQEPGDSFTISGSTITFDPALVTGDVVDYIVDMGRAVTIGEYSGDLAVGGNLTVGGESTFSGDITMSGFPESSYELKGDIDGGIRFTAQAGEALSKGDVVYISGAAGDNTIVSKAQANSSSTMPAFGFAVANASNGASCQIVTFGNLYGSGGAPLNTSAFNVGDTLYVSATTAGGFTSTPPTGESNLLQNIGKIIRSASSNGVIKVGGAGRTNATPNLDDGDIFIGNASNQPVTASLNTKIEDYLDGGTSTPVFSTINSGNITTTGYIAGPSTFTIDPAAVGDNTGTLVVAGNLQVDGTTTTINSTTMTVDDLNITLASGAANAAAANGAGITVDGASATLTYNSTPDAWSFNKNVGIGTASPAAELHINNSSGATFTRISGTTAAVLDMYGGASNTKPIRFFGGSDTEAYAGIRALSNNLGLSFETGIGGSTAATERMRIDSSGNVGIGTTTTTAIRLTATTATANHVGLQVENSNTADSFGMVVKAGNDANDYTADFRRRDNTNIMRIRGDGNVGIGTTSPVVSSGYTSLTINDTTSGYLVLQNNGTTKMEAYVSGGTQATLRGTGVPLAFVTTAAHEMTFDTNATERMRIDANGNVGINTTNPLVPLHVETSGTSTTMGDNAAVTVRSKAAGRANALQFSDGTTANWIGSLSGNLAFATTNTERMRINSSGQVAIGQTTHSNTNVKIDLHNSGSGVGTQIAFYNDHNSSGYFIGQAGNTTGHIIYYNVANTAQDFYNNNAFAMTLSADGKLGIGITSPATNLHILDSNPVVRLQSSGAGTDNTLSFLSRNISNVGAYADIIAEGAGHNSTNAPIVFTQGSGQTERMRMDSSGNVAIGVSSVSPVISSSKTLQINSSGNTTLSVRAIDSVNDRSAILELLSSGNGVSKSIILYGDTDTTPSTASPLVIQKYHSGVRSEVGRFNTSGHLVLGDSTTAYYRLKSGATGTDGGMQWMFNSDATVYASLTLPYDTRATTGLHLYSGYPITYTVPSNLAHKFVAGSSEAARIDAGGIKFNGDTAAANGLDDYEEGNWTPTVSTASSVTIYRAQYTKIGRTVTVSCYIAWTNNQNNNTDTWQIGGLPYSSALIYNYEAAAIGYTGAVKSDDFLLIKHSNSSYYYLHRSSGGNSAVFSNADITTRGLNVIIFTGTYQLPS